ncbi:ABC transporter ATP-binding protein [Isoptericola sp. BMS4]|uniref:ABC transporter ATP-binding protein n=1 Tax=Isoptericola sp. BMS4 TaxID=2527875 RepID=UPI001423155B|nr:ABC transporter ATP-binding protein [Isoptericola sp. BMS4]
MTAISVTHLHKAYRRRRRTTVAVDDVSLTVDEGEIVGLLGRNGAGKSTTVETVAGLRTPDRGEVRVLGLDPRADRARVRGVLGVQLQEPRLHDALTVRELVRLHRSFHRAGRDPDELIDAVGLTDARDTRVEKLSGGQQQRTSVAAALVGDPRVVILDELTSGLDPEARHGMLSMVQGIRAAGVTVLLVSHHMDEVERLCDRAVVLDAGRVVASGSPAGLVAEAGLPRDGRLEDAYLVLTGAATGATSRGQRRHPSAAAHAPEATR